MEKKYSKGPILSKNQTLTRSSKSASRAGLIPSPILQAMCLLAFASMTACTPPVMPMTSRLPLKKVERYRGWDFLADKLAADGIPAPLLTQVFGDPRFPAREAVPFRLQPQETSDMYRGVVSYKRSKRAADFIRQHQRAFDRAWKRYRVEPAVIASILEVETRLGSYLGRELVINRIARVASVSEPVNIDWNYRRLSSVDRTVTRQAVAKRAQYLEKTFYPHVVAFFHMVMRDRIDPFELQGSIAGAFGMPQFMPESYMKYAVDGDGNGKISLFTPADSILSVAHFLAANGWKPEASYQEKRAVIWHYNKSDPYIDSILGLAKKTSERLQG